jgi:hypothetical protein
MVRHKVYRGLLHAMGTLLFISCIFGSEGGPPGIVQNVAVFPGDSQATVTWQPPKSDGGKPISAYEAMAIEDSSKFCGSTSDTMCVVHSLENGKSYSFVVFAVNAKGRSPASQPSASVIPAKVPGQPTSISIATSSDPTVVESGRFTVSWLPPLEDGGSPILGYVVSRGNGTEYPQTNESAREFVVEGQAGGAADVFMVRAVNAAGRGEQAVSSLATIPATVPGSPSPSRFTLALNAGNVRIQWDAPPAFGSSILNYTATISPDDLTCSTSGTTGSQTIHSCTFFGLQNTAQRTVGVVASNALGTSQPGLMPLPSHASWITRRQSEGPSLHGITWTGSRFVAVGDSGSIVTSTDGISWNTAATQPQRTWRGVTWTGQQVIAVGDSGSIARSPDGLTWTVGNTGVSAGLRAVTTNQTMVVAVGTGGTILVSVNGVDWAQRESGTLLDFNAVAWTGQRFVVAGEENLIMSSENTVGWVVRKTPRLPDPLNNLLDPVRFKALTWTGNRLIAVGEKFVMSSCGVPHCINFFYAYGIYSVSDDGLQWSDLMSHGEGVARPGPLNILVWTGSDYLALGQKRVFQENGLVSRDGSSWFSLRLGYEVGEPDPVSTGWASSGTRIVVVGHRAGMGTILTSP